MTIDAMIYNPLEEFESKYKHIHLENTTNHFNNLVKKSKIDIEENRRTVNKYHKIKEEASKTRKKYNLWRFLRVLMILTVILIPLVILKITPIIQSLRKELEEAGEETEALLALAKSQTAPLNSLFCDRDALNIIEKTIPSIAFENCFSVEQEANMITNYDFDEPNNREHSTTDVLAGHYNENPFLFERKLIHKMGVGIYRGSKTIFWTEQYRDSDGKIRTRTRSQTLHASVTKPKPYYSTQVVLNYCTQGGPELSFTRDATHLEEKSDKEIDRYVKKGEKKLKKMTDRAIKENKEFVSMSNSDFEVLFDALDRTNEVQFRTLFTPLAQTNIVDLIRSKEGYGDDFNFLKRNRTNKIISQHSQGRELCLRSSDYVSFSFDEIKESFISKNTEYFKAVFFDFAPLWAIPIYQERPAHSLKPIPDYTQNYTYKEYESLSNKANAGMIADPRTKTQAIIKSSFVKSENDVDEISVCAFSYDIISRVDYVSVHGDDGHWHDVPVFWDDYIPLESRHNFFVATSDRAKDKNIISKSNYLCMFN